MWVNPKSTKKKESFAVTRDSEKRETGYDFTGWNMEAVCIMLESNVWKLLILQ